MRNQKCGRYVMMLNDVLYYSRVDLQMLYIGKGGTKMVNKTLHVY